MAKRKNMQQKSVCLYFSIHHEQGQNGKYRPRALTEGCGTPKTQASAHCIHH